MSPFSTIVNGCLGALTFGMYYQYITLKQIKEHNEKIEKQRKEFLNKMNKQFMYFSFLN